ncbi:MAG: Uma2 family endonuclease, partial [Cyanobacteria bacterium P01_A01_bin.70]
LLGGDIPVWLPEISLSLGRARGTYSGALNLRPRARMAVLVDEAGHRLLTPEERAIKAQERATQVQEQAEKLAAKLRSLGVDPDTV